VRRKKERKKEARMSEEKSIAAWKSSNSRRGNEERSKNAATWIPKDGMSKFPYGKKGGGKQREG
jgi:hypothetical protein